ncbi:hypothetical protein, partial [Acetobacter pomorum]
MIIRKCNVNIKGVSPYSPSKPIAEKPKEYSHKEWEEMQWRNKAHVDERTGKVFVPFMSFKKA